MSRDVEYKIQKKRAPVFLFLVLKTKLYTDVCLL